MGKDNQVFRIAEVISVEDESDGARIKVRLKPEDNRLTDAELPYAYPLIPKIIHIIPKVGESVAVITFDTSDAYTQRTYIGPIISQENHINYEPYGIEADSMFIGARVSPEVAESLKPKTRGAYPNKEDVAFEGRKYSDIILTDNDVRLRSGIKLPKENNPRDISFNDKNGAFLKLRYNPDEQNADDDSYNSTALMVADKVLLLGNVPKDGNIITADRDELVSDDKIKELIEKTHELPYGDKLIEFLIMFRDAFLNHVHPYPTMKPCYTDQLMNLQSYNLSTIISNSIRIN